MRTVALEPECAHACKVQPLARFIEQERGFAGMNGTYFCPPDYAECAAALNAYEYALFDRALGRWLNPWRLSGQNALLTFNGAGTVAYRRSFVYDQSAAAKRAPLTAGVSNFPLLLQNGEILDTSAEQTAAHRARGAKGAIGVDGTHVLLALVSGTTLDETALVLRAIGARDALNLDDDGSAAMFADGG
ncbi:MAG: phosphodiester glycosidase family protein [Chloroflexi bacterium]|nr:phosphodiester glycosidase family protein [Chloroflexota bacterium]